MTVATTDNKVTYSGNGATTAFNFSFSVQDEADLKIYLIDANNVETLQTITTHYTVTLNTVTSGGTVTMVTAPSATESLLILREVALTQTTDIPNVGGIREEQIENVFDSLTMICQQLEEKIGRSLVQNLAAPIEDLSFPSLVTSQFLTNNGSALSWATPTAVDYAGTLSFGLAASKPASPGVGDIYFETDTGLIKVCKTATSWSDTTEVTDLATLESEYDAHIIVYNALVAGLGTAANEDVGTGANQIVQLTSSSKLPSVDGSNLSNLHRVAQFSERQTSGTDGGSATASTWHTRTITNEDFSYGDHGVTRSGNKIQIPNNGDAYLVKGWAVAGNQSGHCCRLRNVTTNVTVALGSSQNHNTASINTTSEFCAIISSPANHEFELQTWTEDTKATHGLGYATGSGEQEVFAALTVERLS